MCMYAAPRYLVDFIENKNERTTKNKKNNDDDDDDERRKKKYRTGKLT